MSRPPTWCTCPFVTIAIAWYPAINCLAVHRLPRPLPRRTGRSMRPSSFRYLHCRRREKRHSRPVRFRSHIARRTAGSFVHCDRARVHGVRSAQGHAEEALGCRRVPSSREQEINRLAQTVMGRCGWIRTPWTSMSVSSTRQRPSPNRGWRLIRRPEGRLRRTHPSVLCRWRKS